MINDMQPLRRIRDSQWLSLLKFLPVLLLAIACAGVWLSLEARAQSKFLTVAFLDVGQGDSIYIESPAGLQVLIDAGAGGRVLQELDKVMPPLDRSLDAVVATHPDADHIGGLVDVLGHYELGAYIESGVPDGTQTARALRRMIGEQNIPVYIAKRGMALDLGGGAYLEILFPDRDVSNLPSSKTNDGSIVARLVYGQSEVMLTGDAPQYVEEHLLKYGAESVRSDILKVGHHGSKTSTSERFLVEVSPDVAIISVGANNRYGHPAQVVLDALQKAAVPVVRTDEEGTIVFVSDGTQFVRRP